MAGRLGLSPSPPLALNRYSQSPSGEGEYRNTHPYAIAPLTHGTIKTLQPYDVDITLTLPRSPGNLDRGNFMVGLLLLGDPDLIPLTNNTTPRFPQTPSALISPIDPIAYRTSRPTLHASLRPTGLPYRSPLTTLAAALLRLPYYALYPDAELATLTVVMAERLTFPRGAPVPRVALVEIQAAGRPYLEVYSAEVTLRSKLGGLRWLMYHYRVTSFVVFTIMFTVIAVWCFLVTFTVGGLVVKALMPAAEAGRKRGEGDWEDEDEEDMSDTERTFPSRRGGAVVKFEGKGVEVKTEDEEEQDPGMEAGDEEEEEGVVVGGIMGERDSGIGTSYDDDTGREGARRRVSLKGKEKMEA